MISVRNYCQICLKFPEYVEVILYYFTHDQYLPRHQATLHIGVTTLNADRTGSVSQLSGSKQRLRVFFIGQGCAGGSHTGTLNSEIKNTVIVQ